MRRVLALCLLGVCLPAGGVAAQQPRDLPQQVPPALGGVVGAAIGALRTAQPPPAAGLRPFEIRLVRIGEIYHVIKFNTATGESWQIIDGRWEKLGEAGPAPEDGEYDIFLVAESELMALRFDYRSGAGWQLRNRKWVRIEEPAKPK